MSTEWKLYLDVDKISKDQNDFMNSITQEMKDAEEHAKSSNNGGRNSNQSKNKQMDLEMLGKVFNIYQQKANEIMQKSYSIMGGGSALSNNHQNIPLPIGGMMNQSNAFSSGGGGMSTSNNKFLVPSQSQPLFNLKQSSSGFGFNKQQQ